MNAADLSPADPTLFAITQPTLTSVPGAIDLRIKSVNSSGSLTIDATNAHVGVHNVILRINSDKSISDTVETLVNFTVTITPFPCSPGITDPVIVQPFNYGIRVPTAVPVTFSFPGLSNGNCQFTTTLT